MMSMFNSCVMHNENAKFLQPKNLQSIVHLCSQKNKSDEKLSSAKYSGAVKNNK
jgi:hypothetical protein